MFKTLVRDSYGVLGRKPMAPTLRSSSCKSPSKTSRGVIWLTSRQCLELVNERSGLTIRLWGLSTQEAHARRLQKFEPLRGLESIDRRLLPNTSLQPHLHYMLRDLSRIASSST